MPQPQQQDRVTLLANALVDTHVSVVWNAARDLARLGSLATAALPALETTLKSHDPTSRLWARFAIVKITGDLEPHLDVFLKALGDKKVVFPGMASAAIAGLGASASRAVPLLIEELKESNPEYRWSAAGALANIGPAAQAASGMLIQTLNDPDEKVRWYSAWALGMIGVREGIRPLIDALDDIDDDVRAYAIRSIGMLGGQEALAALPKLENLLEDDNPNIGALAQEAIGRIVVADGAAQ